MKYTIREIEAFSVIGQEVELTNYQKRNIQISTQFWRKFNSNLKKSYLSQSGSWIKYMKHMVKFIKNYYPILSILFCKKIFCTLKDMIIVFIGTEKVQLLRFGCQLRVSSILV